MSDTQHDDPFEDRLTAALRLAGGTFDTDRTALVTGGRTRGRRAWLRRRAAILGGAAGVALAGVGGALILPGGEGTAAARQSSPAAAGASAPASKAPASFSEQQLIDALKKLLPAGEVSGAEARGTDEAPAPYVHLVFDDGKGPGAIGVSVERIEPGTPRVTEVTTCPDKDLVDFDGCETRRLSDGSLLMLYRGYEYPDRRVDTKWWSAELVTPSGRHVSVMEWNSPAEKDAPITRATPPLSPAQLTKVATAGVWRQVVDALPEDPKKKLRDKAKDKTAPPSDPAPSGSAIGNTVISLLPKGVQPVSHDYQETEYASIVVNDGKGRSLVQINVQPNMGDVAGDLFGGAETLPDGTLVATHQGPGEKGGEGVVMWTVDTLRKDGMRVVISAFNSGRQDMAATREAPALTMAQLRKIALSAKWQHLG
ncbi:hypothetical protein [Streptomyces sp. NPDC003717]|uniref:hypothetical protein n=1 Tax=Streptomyces sp. NPDC003717 TaxID=3154276 RepID=UPI0033BB69B7